MWNHLGLVGSQGMFPSSFSSLFLSFQLCQPSPRTQYGQDASSPCVFCPTCLLSRLRERAWHSHRLLLMLTGCASQSETLTFPSAHWLILGSHDIVERTQLASLEAWVLVPASLWLCCVTQESPFSSLRLFPIYRWQLKEDNRGQELGLWSKRDQGANLRSATYSCVTWDKVFIFSFYKWS